MATARPRIIGLTTALGALAAAAVGHADEFSAMVVLGPGGAAQARVITDAGACPAISIDGRKRSMRESTNVFRVLVKTLFKAGIVTDRTIHVYAAWVDPEALEAEGDTMVGDAIAAEGIEYLREINRKRRVIGQKPTLV